MTITFTDLLIAALATWQIVEIWRHSVIMASWRARAELCTGWRGGLLTCPFCLSVWVAGLVGLVVFIQPSQPTAGGLVSASVGLFWLVAGLILCGYFMIVVRLVPTSRAPFAYGLMAGITGTVLWLIAVPAVFRHMNNPESDLGLWYLLMGFFKVLVLGFAVARLANLGNDLTYTWCRTPKANNVIEIDTLENPDEHAALPVERLRDPAGEVHTAALAKDTESSVKVE